MLIRDAEIDDLMDVFEWRNDLLSCAMFLINKKVTLEEHERWYLCNLTNPLTKLYIAVNSDGKIGICRFSYDELDSYSEVSINLNPKMRGKNFSYTFLFNSIKQYQKKYTYGLKEKIKKENNASIKIFKKCRFFQIAEDDNFYYFNNNKK